MSFPLTGYPIEWAQMIMACIGLCVTLWSVWDVYKDASAVPPHEGARKMLGTRSLWNEIFKTLVLIQFLVVGVSSIILPPPYYGTVPIVVIPDTVDVAGKLAITISRSCIIGATVCMMIDSILSRWVRHLFIRRLTWTGQDAPVPLHVHDLRAMRKDALDIKNPQPRKGEL